MKKISLLLLLFFFSCVSVSGEVLVNTSDLLSYWSMNDTSGNGILDNNGGVNNATMSGGAIRNGLLGNGRNWTDQADYFNPDIIGSYSNKSLTINLWLKLYGVEASDTVFTYYQTKQNQMVFLTNTTLSFNNDGKTITFSNYPLDNRWMMFTYIINSTGTTVYVNGTLYGVNNTGSLYTLTSFRFGNNPAAGTRGINGLMDEVGIWNRTLTSIEISNLYKGGVGLAYPFLNASTDPPTWSVPTPSDGAVNNTNVVINVSCLERVYLWFDNTTNPTTLVINNGTSGNWSTSATGSMKYYYKAGCFNAVTGFGLNSSVRNWTYDVTKPVVGLGGGSGLNSSGYSGVNQYSNQLLPVNFSLSDNNGLFMYQLSVFKSDDVNRTWVYQVNASINGTSYQLNRSINTSTWPGGFRYNFSLLVSDTHTVSSIGDYDTVFVDKYEGSVGKDFLGDEISIDNDDRYDGLLFDTYEGNKVLIQSESDAFLSSTKLVDRYVFNADFDDGLESGRTFFVKSDKPIYYLKDSVYPAHFVVWNQEGKSGNWIDFAGVGKNPVVSKIDDFSYSVYFDDLSSDVSFNSIGGLNVVEYNYSWYKGNYSLIFRPEIVVNIGNNISINISADSSISSLNASLFYNNTWIVGSKLSNWYFRASPSNDFVGSFNASWLVGVNQSDGNKYFFMVNFSQTVYNFTGDNCIFSKNYSLNISFFDEEAPLVGVNVSYQYQLDLDNGDGVVHSTYGNGTNVSSVSFCITPPGNDFIADLYLTYSNGVVTRFYDFNDVLVGGVMKNTSAYALSTSSGYCVMSFSIINNGGTYVPFSNVWTTLYRRYVSQGVYLPVQSILTGTYGVATFYVRNLDTDYQVFYRNPVNGNLYYQTSTLNFNCNSGVGSVQQLLSGLSSNSSGFSSSVVGNNASKLINLTWNDTGMISSVNFHVFKEFSYGNVVICDFNQTGTSGFAQCNVSGSTGLVKYQVLSNGLLVNGGFFDFGFSSFGDELSNGDAAFFALTIFVTLVMVGASSMVIGNGAIVLVLLFSGLSLVVLYMLSLLSGLTFAGLVGGVIASLVLAIAVGDRR